MGRQEEADRDAAFAASRRAVHVVAAHGHGADGKAHGHSYQAGNR